MANNEIRYQTVTDANGNVAAELAMTSSDSNSFGTSCLNYAIGGIGVSDFASYNNSYGADSVSVQFNLPNSASLIIMALASGQNIVTVSGIPGLSVEASNNNGNEGFLIGIASLSAGNYTLTETSSSSSIPGPGNMVDFVGIYEFFESQVSQLSAVSSVPLWAFNGAYADYNMELSYNGVPLSIPVDFNISNVNDNAGTFYVYTSYGGSLTYLSYGTTSTFSSPSPFPAISQSDLSYLNSGVTPPDMQGAQVKTGISVSVPAGTFNTIEISQNGLTLYVDPTSGLLVKAVGNVFQSSSGYILDLYHHRNSYYYCGDCHFDNVEKEEKIGERKCSKRGDFR